MEERKTRATLYEIAVSFKNYVISRITSYSPPGKTDTFNYILNEVHKRNLKRQQKESKLVEESHNS